MYGSLVYGYCVQWYFYVNNKKKYVKNLPEILEVIVELNVNSSELFQLTMLMQFMGLLKLMIITDTINCATCASLIHVFIILTNYMLYVCGITLHYTKKS